MKSSYFKKQILESALELAEVKWWKTAFIKRGILKHYVKKYYRAKRREVNLKWWKSPLLVKVSNSNKNDPTKSTF